MINAPIEALDRDERETTMSIQCGNRTGHKSGQPEWHDSLNRVKACYGLIVLCGWQFYTGTWDEDGHQVVAECGAPITETERGWHCANGHEHVTAQVRQAEGWDYASDPEEAAQLRKHGVQAVGMNGGSI